MRSLAASFCPNIVLELSSLMPHQVLEVMAHVPPHRLMIGSDLPESAEIEIGKILSLQVPDEQKQWILDGTANRVFAGEGLISSGAKGNSVMNKASAQGRCHRRRILLPFPVRGVDDESRK